MLQLDSIYSPNLNEQSYGKMWHRPWFRNKVCWGTKGRLWGSGRFPKERIGKALGLEVGEWRSHRLSVVKSPARPRVSSGGGLGCLGHRWELGETKGQQAPVACEALSVTMNLDFYLSVEGRALLKTLQADLI